MNKSFKIAGFIVVLLLLVFLVLALIHPRNTVVTKSIIIEAHRDSVYQEILFLRNWEHWSPWLELEPGLKLQYFGVDAQPGSGYQWLGDELGSGQMEFMQASDYQLHYRLFFKRPWKGRGDGRMKLYMLPNGRLQAVWSIKTHVRFPLNAFIFVSHKRIALDLERGLVLLKTYCEHRYASKKLNIKKAASR